MPLIQRFREKLPWPQSCPTTNSAQNIVPPRSQKAGQKNQESMSVAATYRPTIARTSTKKYVMDFQTIGEKHSGGMAALMSRKLKGGSFWTRAPLPEAASGASVAGLVCMFGRF